MSERDFGSQFLLVRGAPKAFVSLPFAARVTLVNSVIGSRLWSHQLAAVWLAMLGWMEKNDGSQENIHIVARQLLQLAPQGNTAGTAMSRLVAGENAASAPLVSLIISCRKRLEKAIKLKQSLDKAFGPSFIIVGDNTIKRAIVSNEIISVPSPDNYESLTRKVFEALVAIRNLYKTAAILKMDDDCVVRTPPNLKTFFRAVGSADYVGEPVGSENFDRTWHIGKCEALSPPIYSIRYRRPWARGPLYYLGSHAVDALVRAYLSYPGDFEVAFYEDKCVGDTLATYGLNLVPLPLWECTGLSAGNEVPANMQEQVSLNPVRCERAESRGEEITI